MDRSGELEQEIETRDDINRIVLNLRYFYQSYHMTITTRIMKYKFPKKRRKENIFYRSKMGATFAVLKLQSCRCHLKGHLDVLSSLKRVRTYCLQSDQTCGTAKYFF